MRVARGSVVQSPQGWGAHHRACKAEARDPAKVVVSLGFGCVSLEHLLL